jgi:DUF2075 family protein
MLFFKDESMLNCYYKDDINSFELKSTEEIIGEITLSNQFDLNSAQCKAWKFQIDLLKSVFKGFAGTLFFEFSIPRMGKRVDVLAIIGSIVFVIEFKVGESKYYRSSIEQVWDYALDLKNFHKPSHEAILVPILVATESQNSFVEISTCSHNDRILTPIKTNKLCLREAIYRISQFFSDEVLIDSKTYLSGCYSPTPSIIEAALSLYKSHTVDDITRNDSTAKNLSETTDAISSIISESKENNQKSICFITGVPGSGKTLVGLKVATSHLDDTNGLASVYLSGNGPLVAILQEALVRDKIANEKAHGKKLTKGRARSSVKAFIQNVHHYRDAYLVDSNPPYDHIAIFDEAQRAWNKEQTVKFMKQKKGISDFEYSEPEFLISCLDRHLDWSVIICLVGGGQEINTGEAGIIEWLHAIVNEFPKWKAYMAPDLEKTDTSIKDVLPLLIENSQLVFKKNLHLDVSLRSFRAENLSAFVKHLLSFDIEQAKKEYSLLSNKYPIVLTRSLKVAKEWLKKKARGSERYGIVVSSQAQRLKPFAIDVKTPVNPVYWFLNDKDDVRSSYYLEDVATEFHVQGLELDWACVTWDADLRYSENGWDTYSFIGTKWQHIRKEERKKYLINAYRVLLTRARQGMVIVVPNGANEDKTRTPEFYNPTFEYLRSIGIGLI